MKRSETNHRSKRPGGALIFGLVLLFGIFCLGIIGVLAAMGVEKMTQDAETKFGPAGPGLNMYDRIYYSYQLLSEEKSLLEPHIPQTPDVKVTIDSGASPAAVSQKLQEAGILTDQSSFLTFLIYSGLDSHIQAGDYFLSPGVSAVETARKISDANQTTLQFGFLAGWRSEEIAEALRTSGLAVDPNEFLSIVHSPSAEYIPANLNGISTLEGSLYPDVYELDRSTNAVDLIQTLLNQFDSHVTPKMRQAYTDHGLTLQQAVTLASMVQKEAVVEDEQPLIASVFLNRIAAGMKFESDPTVQYALGFNAEKNTWWKVPLSFEDLEVNSPYNTYASEGFPPGPISNPGQGALNAVAFPAETPYYYFRARCDGTGRHTFANSFDEHIQNECP